MYFLIRGTRFSTERLTFSVSSPPSLSLRRGTMNFFFVSVSTPPNTHTVWRHLPLLCFLFTIAVSSILNVLAANCRVILKPLQNNFAAERVPLDGCMCPNLHMSHSIMNNSECLVKKKKNDKTIKFSFLPFILYHRPTTSSFFSFSTLL